MKKILQATLLLSFWVSGASAAQFFTSDEYATFTASISDSHLETFSSLDPETPVTTPFETEGGNGFQWSLSPEWSETVEIDDLWSLGDGVLSTDSPNATLVFTFTGRDVLAFGGNFWATDINGEPMSATVTFTTSAGQSFVQNTTFSTSFLGVITDQPLTWVSVAMSPPAPTVNSWPTTTNIVTAIPEPSTTALLLGGIAMGVGLWLRRRKQHLHPQA